ncbi:MAG: hypothetical protein QOK47_869 [Actinomycetota bacterium]|nr:hypothetical protein [Actinomycetota bacterium]
MRVFISSTIDELAPERSAATRAVQALRLHPVLFELGARPHPPRELYRAYLEQSDVFIGIYWRSAGWIAPEMDISGIEDEYRLAGDRPKLIYVKEPADGRDERLATLLLEMQSADLSYRHFEDAAELEELIKQDLAILLTERFVSIAEVGEQVADEEAAAGTPVPTTFDAIVGRDREIKDLEELILDPHVPLVTLTGPGGIGKSRLSLEVARDLQDHFKDGAYLVPLEAVTDPHLVVPTILHSIGLQESGGSSALVTLCEYLKPREMLLLVDNFEQVIEAALDLNHIIEECPKVCFLVSSRIRLNLRAEREYPVPPLSLPAAEERDIDLLMQAPSVQMFNARAQKINRSFKLTPENAPVVAEICRRLDGLPLALELAAARTRVLSPESILKRLQSRLALLTSGDRDLPERHHTLRAAIEWSYDLLNEADRGLFVRCAVFKGGWTLEAAALVCNPRGELDVLEGMESLVESSLVRQEESAGEPRFSMFETVREYAFECLETLPERAELEQRKAGYDLGLLAAAYKGFRGPEQHIWIDKVESELDNIRGTMRWCLDHGRPSDVVAAGWSLWLLWWCATTSVKVAAGWKRFSPTRQSWTKTIERRRWPLPV